MVVFITPYSIFNQNGLALEPVLIPYFVPATIPIDFPFAFGDYNWWSLMNCSSASSKFGEPSSAKS